MVDYITSNAPMAPNGAKVLDVDILPMPYSPSYAHMASLRDWMKIRDILGGADQMRSRGETYLPKFVDEEKIDFDHRLRFAPFENHFSDALDSVCDKPFTEAVQLRGDDVPQPIQDFVKDVDGRGTTMHEMARSTFKEGAGFGVAGVFVDYPTLPDGATLADQRKIKARPYWIEVCAEDELVCREDVIDGRHFITELRFVERREEAAGSVLKMLRSVRVYKHDGKTPPTFEKWDEQADASWRRTQEGMLKGMDVIPYKRFVTGRVDRFTGRMISPMIALADLQIEHYQETSNLKHILRMAAYPMLEAAGVTPPKNEDGTDAPFRVGPSVILFSPPNVMATGSSKPGAFNFIEPKGDSIKLLMENLDRIVAAIDKIGKAPLVKSTGRVTATSDAISAAKGHATAEVWAMMLGKMLSAVIGLTAQYLGVKLAETVVVEINTDFGIEDGNIADGTELRNACSAGLISQETYWEELVRRAILGSGFDAKREKVRIAEDQKAKMDMQRAQLTLQAAFAPKGAAAGGAQDGSAVSSAPPPGSSPGLSSDAQFVRAESDSDLSMN